jgi:hypothetical protein
MLRSVLVVLKFENDRELTTILRARHAKALRSLTSLRRASLRLVRVRDCTTYVLLAQYIFSLFFLDRNLVLPALYLVSRLCRKKYAVFHCI